MKKFLSFGLERCDVTVLTAASGPALIGCLCAGIASRAIRPTLGVVDPMHTLSMPERVAANSGFDVLWSVFKSRFIIYRLHGSDGGALLSPWKRAVRQTL